ncbi:MAG: UDP-N-acetylglucosamine 2-epimerase (non-hydrolyzing) [bacterium]
MNPKIMSIVGARPQFIKAWAVSLAIRERGRLQEFLVHTGQHYDAMMSDVFFEELNLPKPDIHLGIGGGNLGKQTERMVEKLEEAMAREKPALALIYGDTNSTLAGAIAAATLRIPIAHVEAGMRCGDLKMPEEINRVVADSVASIFFCPTETAVRNLESEGKVKNVHLSGDVMLDSFNRFQPLALQNSKITETLGLSDGGYCLLTVHRAENADSPERLRSIFYGLSGAGLPVIFPVHPRTKKAVASGIAIPDTIRMIEPLSYVDMLALESRAQIIATDSGGVQKEAYLAGVPCLTLRETTEWPETVAAGWNLLVGAGAAEIREGLRGFRPAGERPPIFGPAGAAGRIAESIEVFLS